MIHVTFPSPVLILVGSVNCKRQFPFSFNVYFSFQTTTPSIVAEASTVAFSGNPPSTLFESRDATTLSPAP